MLLYTFLSTYQLYFENMYLQKGTKWKKELGRSDNIQRIYHILKCSKRQKKQRYGVATFQIVYAAAYEWYKFSLLSELDMYFQ